MEYKFSIDTGLTFVYRSMAFLLYCVLGRGIFNQETKPKNIDYLNGDILTHTIFAVHIPILCICE